MDPVTLFRDHNEAAAPVPTMGDALTAVGTETPPFAQPVGCGVTAGAAWCVGVVTAVDGDHLRVTSGGLQTHAQRALSCLLMPEAGDSVACLRVAPDVLWVTAVLNREDAHVANRLALRGDTELVVEDGELALLASAVSMNSPQLRVSASEAVVSLESAEVVGRQMRVSATVFKVVGSVFSSVMDRVQHFSRHYLRTTEGLDRVQATHIESEASQLQRLSGEHVLMNGEKLVKARGGQIHFG